jgi:hypothetical protein
MGTILQIWRCITLKEVLLLMQGLKRFMGGMMKGKSGCDGMIALTASKVLVGDEIPANGFKTYFVARFSKSIAHNGISHNGIIQHRLQSGKGEVLSGYVGFAAGTTIVDVRIGVSFISIEQARR